MKSYFVLTVILILLILTTHCKKDEIEFSSVPDIDGNKYKTVKIGTQVWMTENLKTTTYNDGTSIPVITDATTWKNLTTPAYCWYNNDETANKATYGALYNWYTLNTGNLCPQGWHVPNMAEWNILINYLGGTGTTNGFTVGKLKESGTLHWQSPNEGASNSTGFTAVPAGYRYKDANFLLKGDQCRLWSSTENLSDTLTAWYLVLESYSGYTGGLMASQKQGGFTIRCIKD